MLKINAGWSQDRLAQQIAFGLSEGNLQRLKEDSNSAVPTGPIAIKGESIKLEHNNFVIFAAERGPEEFKIQLIEMIKRIFMRGTSILGTKEGTGSSPTARPLASPSPPPSASLEGRIEGNHPIMDLDGVFYVIPVLSGDDMVWFIGLHEVSFEKLRKREVLTFRSRIIDGEGTNVEVNLFWSETEEKMIERLKNSAR